MSDTIDIHNDTIDIQNKTTVFQGYFRIDRYVLRFRTHKGTWSQPVTREIFERGHAVAVLLFDPERDPCRADRAVSSWGHGRWCRALANRNRCRNDR